MKCKRTKQTFTTKKLLPILVLALLLVSMFGGLWQINITPIVKASDPTGRTNGLTLVLDSDGGHTVAQIISFMETYHYNALKLFTGWGPSYLGYMWTGNYDDPFAAGTKTKLRQLIGNCSQRGWYVICTISDQLHAAGSPDNDTWHDYEVQVGPAGPNSDLNTQDNWLDYSGPSYIRHSIAMVKTFTDIMDEYVKPRIGLEEIQYVSGGGHPAFYAQCAKDAYLAATGLAIPEFSSTSTGWSGWTTAQRNFIMWENATIRQFYDTMWDAALSVNNTAVLHVMTDNLYYYMTSSPYIYYTQPFDFFANSTVFEATEIEAYGYVGSANWAGLQTVLDMCTSWNPSAKQYFTYSYYSSESTSEIRTAVTFCMNHSYNGVWAYGYASSGSSFHDNPLDVSDIVFAEQEPVPPTYSDVDFNTTIAGAPCKFSVKLTDSDGNVSKATLSTNNTGVQTNQTWTTLDVPVGWANYTITLNSTGGNVIRFQWYFNDTDGLWATTGWWSLTTAATGTNSLQLVAPDDAVNQTSNLATFTYIVSFATAIQNASIWLNLSGTWQNSGWNTTTVLNSTNEFSFNFGAYPSATYVWTMRVYNTTYGLFAVTNRTINVMIDPVCEGISHNTTTQSAVCLFQAIYADEDGLDGYFFRSNNTGAWINQTWTPFFYGGAIWELTLNETAGNVVQYQFLGNDSDGHWATSFFGTLTISTFAPSSPYSPNGVFTVKQGVIFKTSSNNGLFTMGTSFEFCRAEIASTHLWMDKSYSAKHYTRYCIYVIGPDDTQFTVDSWFATKDSSATLTITAPLSASIEMGFTSPNLLYASVSGAASSSWNVITQTLAFMVNTDVSSSFTISVTVTETEYNHSPENVGVEITDMEGCGNWVFSQIKFYTFVAKFWDGDGYADLSSCSVAFTDGLNWVNMTYDLIAGTFRLDDGNGVARLKSGTVTIVDANEIQVTFPIYFQNTILDADNVSLYMRCIDLSGASDGWELMESNYFNIYNLGGHSTLETVGDAGRIVGGDIFDLYCGNMSSVEATVVFRDLQHVKMLPTFQTFGSDYGLNNITFFMEYCVGDVWVRAFSIVLTPSLAYRPDILGGACVRWNWTATYYELGTQIKSEKFWVYFQNYNETQSTIDTQLWIDLWFNKVNASTVWGSRVNAYYYPMVDNSNFWLRWLSGSNWGVDERLVKQSECFGTLRDNGGKVISTLELKLVRIGCNMTTGNIWAEEPLLVPFIARVQHFNVFDLTFGSDPLQGVQTPPWDETKIPTLAQGGLLGSIWTGLAWFAAQIVSGISYAAMTMFDVWVGFCDTVFTTMGFPNLADTYRRWLVDSVIFLRISLEYSFQLLTLFFSFLTEYFGKIYTVLNMAFTTWMSMLTYFTAFLGGTYTSGVNIWVDYNIPQWITLGLILYPIYLVFLWEEEGLGAVIDQLTFLYNVLHGTVYLLLTIAEYIWAGISRLLEAIPVVE